MSWVELLDKRTQTAKHWHNNDSGQNRFEQIIRTPLHYSSLDPDGAIYDATVDLDMQRVQPSDGHPYISDGWIAEVCNTHYGLGIPQGKSGDGWVGIAGRQGEHRLWYRVVRIGYIHWPTLNWQGLGNTSGTQDINPSYSRTNLSRELLQVTLGPDELPVSVNVGTIITWDNIWTTPGGGSVSYKIYIDGLHIRHDIYLNQIARNWIANNRPPLTPTNETYFSFVLQLDPSGIPKWVKMLFDGSEQEQNIDGDFNDSDGYIELRNSFDKLLAFMPIDYALSDPDGEIQERIRLSKRLYKYGNNYYLLVGARTDQLNTLPAGGILFDPSFSSQPDETSSKDTRTDSTKPTTNYGTNDYLAVKGTSGGYISYIEFDCSSIPATATCDTAVLSLWSAESLPNSNVYAIYSLHADVEAWTESGLTWNKYNTISNWPGSGGGSTSGTDYESDASPPTIAYPNSSIDTEAQANLLSGSNLTAARIKGWFGASNTNYGLIIGVTGDLVFRRWHSSDVGTAGYRPKIAITYTTSVTQEGIATLSAAFTAAAAGTKMLIAASALQAVWAVADTSTFAVRPAIVSLPSAFSITPAANIVKETQSLMAATFNMIQTFIVARHAQSPLTAQFSMQQSALAIKQVQSVLAAQFSMQQSTTIITAADALISAVFSAQQSSIAVRQALSVISSVFSMSGDGTRQTLGDVDFAGVMGLIVGANAIAVRQSNSALFAEFTTTYSGIRNQSAQSDMQCQFVLQSDGTSIQIASSQLSTEFTTTLAAAFIASNSADMQSVWTIDANGINVNTAQMDMSSQFVLTPNGLYIASGQTQLPGEFALIGVTDVEEARLSAIFTLVAQAIAIRSGQSSLQSNFTMLGQSVKVKQAAATISAEFLMDLSGVRLSTAISTLSAIFSMQQSGISIQVASTTLPGVFSIVASAGIGSEQSLIAQFSMIANAISVQIANSQLSAQFSMSAQSIRTRTGQLPLSVQFTTDIVGVKLATAVVNLLSQFTLQQSPISIQVASTQLPGVFTITANAEDGSEMLLQSLFSMVAGATRITHGQLDLQSQFLVQQSVLRHVLGALPLQSPFTVQQLPQKIAVASTELPADFQFLAEGERPTVLEAIFNLYANPTVVTSNIATIALITTLLLDGTVEEFFRYTDERTSLSLSRRQPRYSGTDFARGTNVSGLTLSKRQPRYDSTADAVADNDLSGSRSSDLTGKYSDTDLDLKE